jgi:hypothetical protein
MRSLCIITKDEYGGRMRWHARNGELGIIPSFLTTVKGMVHSFQLSRVTSLLASTVGSILNKYFGSIVAPRPACAMASGSVLRVSPARHILENLDGRPNGRPTCMYLIGTSSVANGFRNVEPTCPGIVVDALLEQLSLSRVFDHVTHLSTMGVFSLFYHFVHSLKHGC